jgi:hypothetical protein
MHCCLAKDKENSKGFAKKTQKLGLIVITKYEPNPPWTVVMILKSLQDSIKHTPSPFSMINYISVKCTKYGSPRANTEAYLEQSLTF